ncbi:hypothetical protein [Blastomonas sp. CACIA14H2]|uniref:hypothetical protein n=1 Tax=Blastomonas sp. CACIA14H2 TaxID=1419876 RepID=UPI0026C52A5D
MHKREPVQTITNSLKIAREFPKQVVVLHGVTNIYEIPVRSAANTRKLIDKRQTSGFPEWYDSIRLSHSKQRVDTNLEIMQKQANAQLEEIERNVGYIEPIFQHMKDMFQQEELNHIRKRIPYSKDTQHKLLEIMFDVSRELFKKSGVQQTSFPIMRDDAFHYFIFRYAICMTLLYTRCIRLGNFSSNKNKLTNHVIDMHLAALATFFGGILSDDQILVDIHREARFLLRMSGIAFVG